MLNPFAAISAASSSSKPSASGVKRRVLLDEVQAAEHHDAAASQSVNHRRRDRARHRTFFATSATAPEPAAPARRQEHASRTASGNDEREPRSSRCGHAPSRDSLCQARHGQRGTLVRGNPVARRRASVGSRTASLLGAEGRDADDRGRRRVRREAAEERLVREVEHAAVGGDHQVAVAEGDEPVHGLVELGVHPSSRGTARRTRTRRRRRRRASSPCCRASATMPTIGWLRCMPPVEPWNLRVAEAEHAAVGADHVVAVTRRRRDRRDHRAVQRARRSCRRRSARRRTRTRGPGW